MTISILVAPLYFDFLEGAYTCTFGRKLWWGQTIRTFANFSKIAHCEGTICSMH